MAELISFDGARNRISASTPRRYHPANRHEVTRIVRCYYGGMSGTSIARREKIGLNEVERLVRENSRPIDIKPLALDWRLRRAA